MHDILAVDTPGHVILSAELCALGVPEEWKWTARIAGGLLGGASDIIPWCAWKLGLDVEWGAYYQYLHSFHWWFVLVPPFLLHWGIDKLWHKKEGGWVPYWPWLEIGGWILIAGLVFTDWRLFTKT